ncbi:MAG TPA: PVC-type heme-binding CxxCH protein [Verrucomicrobiae bacterium]|nr:PVC-type heme-binding CxxCH protein [Verrucomicrobiae bacterium]
MASFKVAPGFEVNLFASEKDGVVKPIQSRFDASGRLYVIGSTVYPQLQPGQQPNDKVIILEDTDGDGRADKTTVFADGLFIPTGLEIGDGGVYVGNSTELLHLRDTDGDGRADERRVVLRGFGTGDNHQNINSFQWGPSGELMFSQGLHSNARVETPWGIERLDRAGIWRLRPRLLRLDPFFGGEMAPHNPWGFVFDSWGQPLVLAGNGHGIYYPVPVMIRGHRYTDIDQIWQNYRGRKLCGGDYVANAHFPDDWQGVLIAGGFMNNTVWALKVTEDGSGFSVADLPPLLTSTNTSFRPVDVKLGPDGAVYITDWYNPIIGHYQASFRHPDRDKVHGRVWRVTAKDRPLVKPQPGMAKAPAEQLLNNLKSADRFTSYQSKRLLADFDTRTVTNALARWVAALDPNDPRYERNLYEAIGVYESHEAVEPALLQRLLRTHDPHARAYAARVVGHWQDQLKGPLDLLRPLMADEFPRVRLEAIVAATYVRDAETLDVVLAATDKPVDKFIDYALRQAVYVLKPEWLPVFTKGRLQAEKYPARLEFLLKADGSPDTTRVLRSRLESGAVEPANREAFLGILAETGGADDLAYLLTAKAFTIGGIHDAPMHARVLPGVGVAERLRKTRPSGDLAAALNLLLAANNAEALRAAALRLAGVWKVEGLRPALTIAATNDTGSDVIQVAAIDGLATFGGVEAMGTLHELAAPGHRMSARVAAISGLVGLDLTAAATRAAELIAADTEGTDSPRILPAFVARKGATATLAAALTAKPPTRDAARMALRWLNSAGRQDKPLVAALNTAAGLEGASLRATPEFVQPLVAEIRAQGNAANGARIFRRMDLSCMNCHSIAGEGGNIGPDLNSIGAGQPLDFIIGAVLEPNKEVKENYEAVEVTTKDGESHTGYRVRAAGSEFALRDVAENKVLRFRRDEIQSIVERGSVMPPGLVDHLTRAELRDLFRYLSELGKARP